VASDKVCHAGKPAGGLNMKRIWSVRKEKEGVSPVIATILMVAITVVLAAVLYVMVIQFGGDRPDFPPTTAWNDVGAQSTTEGKLVFGMFSYDVAPIEIRIHVKANGSDDGTITIPSSTASAPQLLTWTGAANGESAIYYDYNPSGAKLNQGDYIELDGLLPGSTYSFELYHTVTEAIVTGSATDFSTP
jgi:flagellin-like protein